MNKKSGFPDLPFQDSHKLVVCTDSVICSVTNGVFTADSECACLLCHLLLGSIFLNTFPYKAHKLGISIPGTNRPSLKEESVRLPSIATCIK